MEEIPTGSEPTPRPARPVMLTVLCILTFIGSGMNFMSGLLFFAFYDVFLSVLGNLAKTMNLPGMEILQEAKPSFFLFSAFFYALSFAGALLMFNLKKTGFHLYTIAQILLIVATMYFLKLPGPSILDVILSGIFIVLYGIHLKFMK
jgi:hypothetical protein